MHTFRGALAEDTQFLRLNNATDFERFCRKKKSSKSKIGTSFVNVIIVTTHNNHFYMKNIVNATRIHFETYLKAACVR